MVVPAAEVVVHGGVSALRDDATSRYEVARVADVVLARRWRCGVAG